MAQNFPFEINADKYSRQLWSKQAYLYLAEFFRKAVFDTNVQVIEGGTIDDYRFSGPAEDWRLPGGGGGGAAETDYAWKISATEVFDNGDPYDPPKFIVNVLGGPAQVLGGEEHVFSDLIGKTAYENDYVYIRYNLWSASGAAICAWVDEILVEANPPFDEIGGPGVPKTLVFCLGKISKTYLNNVNQYRVGAIQAVAILNASPEHDAYHTVEIP